VNNKYLFATEKENYEDYSSGRVLYGAPSAPNFPVRLASELFQRCANYLKEQGSNGPYKLYDPFCGAGYSLTVIGFLFSSEISSSLGSDSDESILDFAKKNLSLLSKEGMDHRIDELNKFTKEYNKDSHRDALKSAEILKDRLISPIESKIFQFNSIEHKDFPESINNIDIIIADLPYGKLTSWNEDNNQTQIFLDAIRSRLKSVSIVALISNKEQKISHTGYTIVEKYNLGKRKIILLTIEN
jgi:23S rRNA G2445 N2-methylase RlmL